MPKVRQYPHFLFVQTAASGAVQDADGNWVDDPSIEILGGSSDHTLMDMTKADREYKVGDTVTFRLEYGAMLKVATSPYVEKEYR